jgi:proteasome lid subunit RPN8/RPN11
MKTTVVVPGLDGRIRSEICDHVFANDDHEVGGVLIGYLGDGELPTVTGSIAAYAAEGLRASVTFTHQAWLDIHAHLDAHFPDQTIVGWYHSHPGFGIFLSTYDRFVHQHFFSEPRQIAYVIDPHAGTEGVFHWNQGELMLLGEGRTDRRGSRRSNSEVQPGSEAGKADVEANPSRLPRRLAMGCGLALVLGILVLGLTQLLLPGIAAHRLRTSLLKNGHGVHVTLSAFPAIELLFHRADRVTVRIASLHSGSGHAGDLLANIRQVGSLNASIGTFDDDGLYLHDLRLTHGGNRISASAVITSRAIEQRLPIGLTLTQASDGLVLSDKVNALGVHATVRAQITTHDGAIVIQPDLSGLAALADGAVRITLFRNPVLKVEHVSSSGHDGVYRLTATARYD